jgi:uncharacterized membrane protein YhaH (DUF805 family)
LHGRPESRLRAFLKFLFGYQGRFSRLDFWLGMLATVAAASFLAGLLEEVTRTGGPARIVARIVVIGVPLWIHSAATIKRLHDRDISGWWYPLYLLGAPGLLMLALYFNVRQQLDIASILYVLSPIGFLWVFTALGFIRGTRGPNRYGSDPTAG